MTRLHRSFCHAPLAHRGLHDVNDGRPENSPEAISAAITHGYGLEIDVQMSCDGEAMVFHDYDLARLTGCAGEITAWTAADLSNLILTGGNSGIPDLRAVLDQVAGAVPLLIELKDQHGQMGPTDGRLEQATAKALDGYDGPVGLMSFNPEMIARFAKERPDVSCGLVTCAFPKAEWDELDAGTRERLAMIPDYDRVGASFVSHQITDLASPRLAELKAEGADILCWTVRSALQEAEARRIVDNVTFEGYLAKIPG